jgi:hypothetical protein
MITRANFHPTAKLMSMAEIRVVADIRRVLRVVLGKPAR